MLSNYICALDIGSSKIAGAVADVKKRHINNIYLEIGPSKGIQKGVIVNSIDLVNSIGQLLMNLRSKSGINIKFVYANISGQNIVTKHSNAIIPLAERGNKVITTSDIYQINEQARILGSSLEEEAIHQIPFSYSIDSKSDILNPLGLYSHRLEVDLYLICGKLSSIQTLTRAINQAGYEIKDLFFSGMATAEAIFNQDLKKGINIFCDIGSDIIELLLFDNGTLKNIEILPIGGDDLTWELSEMLKIPFELAEDIKRSYGAIGDYSEPGPDKEILLKKDNLYKPIKQKAITEIMTSKTKSICQAIKEAQGRIISSEKVDNFITCGRMVLLEGFLEALESSLGIPVKIGKINNPEIVSFVNQNHDLTGQKYLTYITVLGMISQALHVRSQGIFSAVSPQHNPILKAVNKVKEIYQEYF
jgi:cell division protein FtsA